MPQLRAQRDPEKAGKTLVALDLFKGQQTALMGPSLQCGLLFEGFQTLQFAAVFVPGIVDPGPGTYLQLAALDQPVDRRAQRTAVARPHLAHFPLCGQAIARLQSVLSQIGTKCFQSGLTRSDNILLQRCTPSFRL